MSEKRIPYPHQNHDRFLPLLDSSRVQIVNCLNQALGYNQLQVMEQQKFFGYLPLN